MSHPRRGVRAVGSVVSLEIRSRVIAARVAETSVRWFEHSWREGRGRWSCAGSSVAMVSGREQRGEFRAARLRQTLRAEHETISHRLRKLAGTGTREAVALVMMPLIRRGGVGLKLGGARLRSTGHFDL